MSLATTGTSVPGYVPGVPVKDVGIGNVPLSGVIQEVEVTSVRFAFGRQHRDRIKFNIRQSGQGH